MMSSIMLAHNFVQKSNILYYFEMTNGPDKHLICLILKKMKLGEKQTTLKFSLLSTTRPVHNIRINPSFNLNS